MDCQRDSHANSSKLRLLLVVVAAAAVALSPARVARAAPAIASSYGSGSFGRWEVDAFGLPFYRYTADEQTDPDARQLELDGATRAQHELGNDHIKGMAYNDGYTALWSQDLLAQWANLYEPQSRHYAGGYGYLNVDGRAVSTLYLDRPAGSRFEREFGVGYYRRVLRTDRVTVAEGVYAPFGNDPLLLHDVTITNDGPRTRKVTWYEYWDVNPYSQTTGAQYNVGLGRPHWSAATRTLTVAQDAAPVIRRPLSIFASALAGPVSGFETSLPRFFGSGTRAAPAEVVADRVSDSIAPRVPSEQVGDTLFVFRAPVRLRPGRSVTLRYAYGIAHRAAIGGLVSRYARAADPFRASELAWARWLPKADFGHSYRWVARELEWDAYLLRAATVYEQGCGEHTITQGGDYQYAMGQDLGFRSWLHYILPITYSDPELAREILRYAVQLQPPGPARDAVLPYGTTALCKPIFSIKSNDTDFWLMLGAVEYGLGTRDKAFFSERLPFYGTRRTATVWQHIKIAVAHQESLLGPHGLYSLPTGFFGDWNDASATFEGLTESTLVAAQLAYIYPRLAELAERLGDAPFARELERRGRALQSAMRAQWTGRWYSRGYAGSQQVGDGVIFGEPQPWAILAGVPSRSQARRLVQNIQHFLGGAGEPGGPSRIGAAMVPAYNAPDITERGGSNLTTLAAALPESPVANAAEWPGGSWYDINGWLTWALGSLDGELPGARRLAWSEYLHNTLANHATAYPDSWDGTISSDDVCNGYYSPYPQLCGNSLSTQFDGQNSEQPTWMVMDAIRLAGISPTGAGFLITPHLPLTSFSLRLPEIGVAASPGLVRGYVRVQQSGVLTMRVAVPPGRGSAVIAYAGGHRVPAKVARGWVTFTLSAQVGSAADWAVERGRRVR